MKTINSFRSKLLALTLALMASVSTFAYDFVFANDFHIDGFGYKIISNNEPCAVGLMEIADCTEDVVIPATVTYNGLQYIVSTVGMGGSIITNDARITIKSIFIPKTIQVVNMRALSDCPHLCSIVVDEENPYLDSRNDCNAIVTSKDWGSPANTLIAGCQTTTIPNSVTEIGDYAFYRCDSLKHMTVPNGVTTINNGAFSECSSLSSIKLPESLTNLSQQWIFSECKNLKEVFFFAKTPPYIAYGMFRGITPTIYVPKESLDAYKKALYWQNFDIQSIPYQSQWCDTWNIFVKNGSVYPPHEETYRYQLAQDIVIGDYTYTTVVSKAINDALDAPRYVAAVRFTDDRKVYIYYDNAEYLLYDFNVQEGEELEVFAGINNYTSEIKTYKCTVTGVEQYACVGCPATITLEVHNHPDDFREFYRQTQWIEGVGDFNGFLNGINHYIEMDGGGSEYLLCAHKGDELKYTGPLYEEYGCEYNAGPFNEKLLGTWRVVGGNEIISISDSIIVFIGLTQKYTASATQLTVERLWIPEEESYRWANCNYTLSNDTLWIDNFMPLLVATYPPTFGPITLVKVKYEDLFPTLWGLQRTSCDEWYDGCGENKSYLFAPKEVKEINGKLYLKCGGVFLREEDSKVLIYSFPYEKDFVLYDYTLEVGGTLQNLGIDIYSFPELEYAAVVDYIAYEDYDVETDEFIIKKEPLGSKRVQEVSTITLLDGKEYKRWLFGNDWENGDYYIEGIGNVGGSFGGDYIDIANPYGTPISTCYLGERLVCASKNNKLLYQMDYAEMERLGAECLCDYDRGPRKDNAKNGKIGGRPTPTQWNMLEVETKEMDGTPTILRAETFSYTLENDSIVANNKTFYQLARQSTKDTAITKSFVGALHFGEDEDNRVYFLRDGVEYVLYDFTAEPGDTIEIFAGINNYPQETTYTHVVTGKDTLENGACRMMLEVVFPEEIGSDLEQQHLQKIWLAGLGSIDGIVHNVATRATKARSSETQSSVMLCAWRDDNCLYTTDHPDYDTYGCVYNQDPTGVEDVETLGTQYQKILRDGHLYILRDNKIYDVLGTPILKN